MAQHTLEVDGYEYTTEERAFEGVMFQVHITETTGGLEITEVSNLTSDAAYLDKFRMERFREEVRERVQANIDYLKRLAEDEGKTITGLLDEWERDEPTEQRINLLREV